ncbi:hypothetical protein [Streptomyces sp. NPDC059786]|uniref:hypothetical protein n=1 Tax=Streptomyces sp. NPDC059786 TaxID=3346946 RepID=UPI003666CE3B
MLTTGAMCAAFALAVVPASANPSTTWTATPNPANISAVVSGYTTLTAGTPLVCTQSTMQGSMYSAVGNPATVATFNGLSFGTSVSPCQTALGIATFVPSAPWHFLAVDYNPATGVASGYLADVYLRISAGISCVFTTAGKASATYRNSTGVLSVNSVPGELAVTSVTSGCGTTVTTATLPTFRGNYIIRISGTTTAPTLVGSNP